MGTRHLIEVIIDNELKVAQYGQWDGYYTGQGADIADFIQKQMDLDEFSDNLRKCSFFNDASAEKFNEENAGKNWQKDYPWLSRDCGSEVLRYIQDGSARVLQDSRDFKEDGLFCEFHYLINMDTCGVSVNGKQEIPFKDFTSKRMSDMESEERDE